MLAFVAIGFLIFFIHHVATSIQASSIMEQIAETIACLGRQEIGDDATPQWNDAGDPATINPVACSSRRGYVTSIDHASLDRLAETMNCVIRVERGLGDFAIQGQPLASIRGCEGVDESCLTAVAAAFEISRQRTADLDPAFGVRQLVDVAIKALSSGANDPTTASTALDYLTAVLVQATVQGAQNGDRGARVQFVRVQRRVTTFSDLLRMSFGEVRQAAHGNLATLDAMARSLDALDKVTTLPARRRMLLTQSEALLDAAKRAYLPDCDVADLHSRILTRIASLSTMDERGPAADCVHRST